MRRCQSYPLKYEPIWLVVHFFKVAALDHKALIIYLPRPLNPHYCNNEEVRTAKVLSVVKFSARLVKRSILLIFNTTATQLIKLWDHTCLWAHLAISKGTKNYSNTYDNQFWLFFPEFIWTKQIIKDKLWSIFVSKGIYF